MIMKKLVLLFLSAFFVAGHCMQSALAQENRKELVKMTSSEINRKATKAARSEAKSLKKEGWKVTPGALPLDRQLDRSYMMQYEFDEVTLMPKYVMGEAMSVGATYDAAKMQALELARQNLAGSIQAEVASMAVNDVSNDQLSAEQAESITRTVSGSQSRIAQNLKRTMTVVEAYRTLPNRNKEVLVRIAYSMEAAMETVKDAVRQEMQEKGEELHDELDVFFNQKFGQQ